jgi:hypothetical protein
MAIKKNGWTSNNKHGITDFGIEFNSDFSKDAYFLMVEEILQLTEKYSICKVDIDNDYLGYMKHLDFTWSNLGYFAPFYLPGYKFYSEQFSKSFTNLYFYENGELVNRDVSLLGNILFEPSYITIKENKGFYFFEWINSDLSEWMQNYLEAPISISLFGMKKGEKVNPNGAEMRP